MARSYVTLGRSPEYVAFALCGACSSASWFTFCASAPYVLSDLLGEPASTYGVMILLPMATYMLGNGLAARLAPRIGSLRLVLCGRALAFAAAIGMAAWWWFGGLSVWMLFVPITFTSIGDGLSQPAAMASALSIYPRLAGTASGLMGFLQMAVAALGTITVAALPHDSALGLIAVVGGLYRGGFRLRDFRRDACRRPAAGPAASGAPAIALPRQFAATSGGFGMIDETHDRARRSWVDFGQRPSRVPAAEPAIRRVQPARRRARTKARAAASRSAT